MARLDRSRYDPASLLQRDVNSLDNTKKKYLNIYDYFLIELKQNNVIHKINQFCLMLNDYIYSDVDSKDDFQLKTAEMMHLTADRFMSLL